MSSAFLNMTPAKRYRSLHMCCAISSDELSARHHMASRKTWVVASVCSMGRLEMHGIGSSNTVHYRRSWSIHILVTLVLHISGVEGFQIPGEQVIGSLWNVLWKWLRWYESSPLCWSLCRVTLLRGDVGSGWFNALHWLSRGARLRFGRSALLRLGPWRRGCGNRWLGHRRFPMGLVASMHQS